MANRFQAQLAREAGSWCAPGPAGDPVYGLVESRVRLGGAGPDAAGFPAKGRSPTLTTVRGHWASQVGVDAISSGCAVGKGRVVGVARRQGRLLPRPGFRARLGAGLGDAREKGTGQGGPAA